VIKGLIEKFANFTKYGWIMIEELINFAVK